MSQTYSPQWKKRGLTLSYIIACRCGQFCRYGDYSASTISAINKVISGNHRGAEWNAAGCDAGVDCRISG